MKLYMVGDSNCQKYSIVATIQYIYASSRQLHIGTRSDISKKLREAASSFQEGLGMSQPSKIIIRCLYWQSIFLSTKHLQLKCKPGKL